MSSCTFSKIPRAIAGLATRALPSSISARSSSTRSHLPIPCARSQSSVPIVVFPATSSTACPSHKSRSQLAIDRHVTRLRASRAPVAPPAIRSAPATLCRSQIKAGNIVSSVSAVCTSKTQSSALKPCIRKNATPAAPKTVRWSEDISRGFNKGWEVHSVRGFLPQDPPGLVRPIRELLLPSPVNCGFAAPKRYTLDVANGLERALPRKHVPAPRQAYPAEHLKCQECRDLASAGGLRTRFRPSSQTVLCFVCLDDPDQRCNYRPPLEEFGECDIFDTCADGEHMYNRSCQVFAYSRQEDESWRESVWPEDIFF